MRFIINPAGNRIVEATPEETHALRPVICAVLRRYGCPEREIDDIAQNVEIITWQAVRDTRIMGHDLEEPRDALVMWMIAVARGVFLNYRTRASTRHEVFPDDPFDVGSGSPVARLEAREFLRKLEAHPKVARLLLNAAAEMTLPEREEDSGCTPGTYYVRITAAQRWARKVATTGVWRRPPMPDPPTPKHRKKNR